MTKLYQEAAAVMETYSDLDAARRFLQWDQETLMPAGAIKERSERLAGFDSLQHRILTSESTRELIARIRTRLGEFDDDERPVLSEFIRRFDDKVKLPETLVAETARAQSYAGEAWKKARAANSFASFAPHLQKLLDLKIEAAECYGYEEHRLDALINLYERGLTVAQIKPVFSRLKEHFPRLLAKVQSFPSRPDNTMLRQPYDKDTQLQHAQAVIRDLGFNFDRGRVDLSAHPFCTHFAHSDVRLTTRIDANDARTCMYSLMHEAGHGMYEQGIDERLFRTLASGGTSMGIHESQSLFWEDIIGRSREFWHWAFPRFQEYFPGQTAGSSAEDIYRAVNTIEPSLIRIDADELTYHMHIILRFEMEVEMISRQLDVDDVPAMWNAKMEEYLGVKPDADANGCLQDVHWSFGGFGYFPTYSLGKLYAAMMWNQIQIDIPPVRDHIREGKFAPILAWLREKVHRYGRTRNSSQIINDICGRDLSEADFVSYIDARIDDVYGN